MTLAARGLRFSYGADQVLTDVNLEVRAGEVVCILGPSGTGKTSLLRCISGLEVPADGKIELDGGDVTNWPAHRRKIGMMFQEPSLFPHLNVAQNIAFGIRYLKLSDADAQSALERSIHLLDLADKRSANVTKLSGGQRQRVALARTLAAGPRAVLLDEPLSSLDRPTRNELGARIRETIQAAEVPVVWVTHDESEAAAVADRIFRLSGGVLTEQNAPASQ